MPSAKTAAKDTAREMPYILVVDDEKSICELLEITFRKEGYRVEVVHSVDAAKRKLESQIFDIIISDIRMPGAGGVDLLKFSKEIAPSSVFLLITGVPTVETAIAAINAGADRYVIKDHELVDQLRRAVQEVSENLKWKKEAGSFRANSDHRAPVQPRSDYRRERHRQGTGGPRDSRKQRPRRGSLHHHQLRRVSRNPSGIGAFRLHEGSIHRRERKPPGPLPGCPWRHALNGRNRQHEPDHAGQALSRPAGGKSSPPWQHGRNGR